MRWLYNLLKVFYEEEPIKYYIARKEGKITRISKYATVLYKSEKEGILLVKEELPEDEKYIYIPFK